MEHAAKRPRLSVEDMLLERKMRRRSIQDELQDTVVRREKEERKR